MEIGQRSRRMKTRERRKQSSFAARIEKLLSSLYPRRVPNGKWQRRNVFWNGERNFYKAYLCVMSPASQAAWTNMATDEIYVFRLFREENSFLFYTYFRREER